MVLHTFMVLKGSPSKFVKSALDVIYNVFGVVSELAKPALKAALLIFDQDVQNLLGRQVEWRIRFIHVRVSGLLCELVWRMIGGWCRADYGRCSRSSAKKNARWCRGRSLSLLTARRFGDLCCLESLRNVVECGTVDRLGISLRALLRYLVLGLR